MQALPVVEDLAVLEARSIHFGMSRIADAIYPLVLEAVELVAPFKDRIGLARTDSIPSEWVTGTFTAPWKQRRNSAADVGQPSIAKNRAILKNVK